MQIPSLKNGDFIVSIEGWQIADYSELNQLLKGKKGGDKIKAECARVDKSGKITYFEIEFKLMTDTSGDFKFFNRYKICAGFYFYAVHIQHEAYIRHAHLLKYKFESIEIFPVL